MPDLNYDKRFELRSLFKNALEVEGYASQGASLYRKLSHFVWVQEIKENIPGTWTYYLFYKNGIAIATTAICINEWLDLHDLPRRRPFSERTVEIKIKANNNDTRIDNRTPESIIQTKFNGNKPIPALLTNNIYKMYQDGILSSDIARYYSVTPAAINYHLKKAKKELDNTTV